MLLLFFLWRASLSVHTSKRENELAKEEEKTKKAAFDWMKYTQLWAGVDVCVMDK